jgi:hypothetical protein
MDRRDQGAARRTGSQNPRGRCTAHNRNQATALRPADSDRDAPRRTWSRQGRVLSGRAQYSLGIIFGTEPASPLGFGPFRALGNPQSGSGASAHSGCCRTTDWAPRPCTTRSRLAASCPGLVITGSERRDQRRAHSPRRGAPTARGLHDTRRGARRELGVSTRRRSARRWRCRWRRL